MSGISVRQSRPRVVHVTRAASEGNLGNDLSSQLTRHPRALLMVACVLTVLGLLWRHLHLASRLERLAAVASVFSLYAIWIALVLAAAFGTSRSTPIAGTGYQGEAWQEALVSTLFGVGSGALIVAILCVLWGLRPARGASE